MKWGILILLILGCVAAACASVLVGAVKFNPFASDDEASAGVEVVVAKTDMPAMTTMSANKFDKKVVPRKDLPAGLLVSATAALGRALAVPVVEGQVLKESDFVWQGTGADLAAKLDDGMRAFTINLGNAVPDRILLYPGCIVDVLFSARLPGGDRRGQAIAVRILQGIQVLSVWGESVVSVPTAGQGESRASNKTSSRGLTVTLLVDAKQAVALQLASDNGTLSLTLRNPLDKKLDDMEAMVLNQGQLANISALLSPEDLASAQKYKEWQQTGNRAGDPNQQDPGGPNKQAVSDTSTDVPVELSPGYGTPKSRPWAVTVIRGRQTEEEELPAAKNGESEGKTK
jgi:Flp pilus assembly protein CpaB